MTAGRVRIRPARASDLDTIHRFAFDAWGGGLAEAAWLEECRSSPKYRSGRWKVLETEAGPASALIVYRAGFELPAGCAGIGSVCTAPRWRGRGLASRLVAETTRFLLHECEGVFLHSDIGAPFYERLGYRPVPGRTDAKSVCMVAARDGKLPDLVRAGATVRYF